MAKIIKLTAKQHCTIYAGSTPDVPVNELVTIPPSHYGEFYIRLCHGKQGIVVPDSPFPADWSGIPKITLVNNSPNDLHLRAGDEIGELHIRYDPPSPHYGGELPGLVGEVFKRQIEQHEHQHVLMQEELATKTKPMGNHYCESLSPEAAVVDLAAVKAEVTPPKIFELASHMFVTMKGGACQVMCGARNLFSFKTYCYVHDKERRGFITDLEDHAFVNVDQSLGQIRKITKEHRSLSSVLNLQVLNPVVNDIEWNDVQFPSYNDLRAFGSLGAFIYANASHIFDKKRRLMPGSALIRLVLGKAIIRALVNSSWYSDRKHKSIVKMIQGCITKDREKTNRELSGNILYPHLKSRNSNWLMTDKIIDTIFELSPGHARFVIFGFSKEE